MSAARSSSHWGGLHDDPKFLALFDEIMSKNDLDADEQRAGELLTAILGATHWVPIDVGDTSGKHELELVMPDSSRIAVEVTSHTAGNRAAFVNELPRRNPIEAESLRFYWQVDIDVPGAEWKNHKSIRPLLDRIEEELEEVLLQVEREELFQEVRFIRPGGGSREEHPLRRRLRDLSIVGVNTVESCDGGQIWIQPPYSGMAAFNADDIARAAAAHIKPKLGKLLAAKSNGASEAHLFVWLPPGIGRSPGAAAAIRGPLEHERITATIDLRGLDAVWVTSSGRQAHNEVHGHHAPVYRHDKNGWRKFTLGWTETSA